MYVKSLRAACLMLLTISSALPARTDVAPPRPKAITISPEKLDFPAQAAQSSSQPLAATLTNVSSGSITIRDISVSGIDFNATNDCPASLAPNASCKIQVTFTPATTGPRLGTVIVSVSDPSSPLFLILSGTGQ
jgi:hypothetical protein